jgi:hypothetical protein
VVYLKAMSWRFVGDIEEISEVGIGHSPGEIRTGYLVCAHAELYRYNVLADEVKKYV